MVDILITNMDPSIPTFFQDFLVLIMKDIGRNNSGTKLNSCTVGVYSAPKHKLSSLGKMLVTSWKMRRTWKIKMTKWCVINQTHPVDNWSNHNIKNDVVLATFIDRIHCKSTLFCQLSFFAIINQVDYDRCNWENVAHPADHLEYISVHQKIWDASELSPVHKI